MARGRRSAAPRPAPMARKPAPAQTKLAPRPQATPAAAAQAPSSKGPGLMSQMAATAGGVAIGSAVGHVLGGAMTGAFSSSGAPEQPVAANQQQQSQKPCEFELQQFLDCSQNYDLSLCQGFSDVLKQCRTRFGA